MQKFTRLGNKMTRIITILIASIALIYGFTWAANNDSIIAMEWLGYRIQTSIITLIIFAIILIYIVFLLYKIFAWLCLLPQKDRYKSQIKSYKKLISNIETAMIFIANGEYDSAQNALKKLAKYEDNLLISNILNAQIGLHAKNHNLSIETYKKLTQNKATKSIGYKGLAMIYQKSGDTKQALINAEKLYKVAPNSDGAAAGLLDLYKNNNRWEEVGVLLKNSPNGVDIKLEKSINHSILADIESRSGNLNQAKNFIDKASKNHKFVAITHLAADIFLQLNQKNKTLKLIKFAWQKSPDIFIANKFLDTIKSLSTHRIIAEANELANCNRASLYSEYVLANANLLVCEIFIAKKHLNILKTNIDQSFSAVDITNLEVEILRQDGKNSSIIEAEKLSNSRNRNHLQNGYLSPSDGKFYTDISKENYRYIHELIWVENHQSKAQEIIVKT